MATVDPETQARAAAGPTLLSLPLEVKNMIYRLLLVANKPLSSQNQGYEYGGPEWASLGEYHLQPAILRVSWQLHREASVILNCENTFGIRIRPVVDKDGDVVTSSFRNSHFTDGLSSFWDSSMDKFQRFEIVIADAEHSEVQSGVGELCRCYLSKSRALQRVSIHLLYSFYDDYTVLGPFGALRNLRSVDIHGAPPPYAKHLRRLMLGNTPPLDWDGMYQMLKKYVEALDGGRSDLEEASKAMRKWNVQKFQETRSNILSDGQRCIDRAFLHMFDFDAKSEEDHQSQDRNIGGCDGNAEDDHEP